MDQERDTTPPYPFSFIRPIHHSVMGQVTSSESLRFKDPIFCHQALELEGISIQSRDGLDSSKKITLDDEGQVVITSPTMSLSKFTQNTTRGEFPFLLDCYSSDLVVVKLMKKDPDHVEILNQDKLVLRFYNEDHELIHEKPVPLEKPLGSTTATSQSGIPASASKLSLDPKHLDSERNPSGVFTTSFTLDEMVETGKYYFILCTVAHEILSGGIFTHHDLATPVDDTPIYNDHPVALPADGEDFHRRLLTMENSISTFSVLIKTLAKKAQALDAATRNIALARSGFSSYLSNLTQFGRDVENDAIADLVNQLVPCFTEQSTRDIRESSSIAQNITLPLVEVYNTELKALQHKYKQYHEHARTFYDDTQVRTPTPVEHREFELHRFDYFQFLNGPVNGLAMRKLLLSFSRHLQHCALDTATSINTTNVPKAEFLYKNYGNFTAEQARLRNALELELELKQSKGPTPEPLEPLEQDISDPSAANESTMAIINNKPPTALSKSGVLYTLGGRGKSGWHKQLIALQDNLLLEYVDYKKPEKMRNAPLDITFACVKHLDTMKDRPYCIEVITPRNVKRLFQVSTEAERESWVQALTKAAGLKADDNQYNKKQLESPNADTMSQLPRANIVNLEITDDLISTPLSLVQEVDVSNRICCDCGSIIGVEWISLNLLVVLCINCSGVHRSLGSHITKIRSLALDEKVFESKEMHDLLYHVSNSFFNAYMASGNGKISSDSSDEERKEYITDKYVNKRFIQQDASFNANDALIKAVHSANVPLVLKALAYGANTSMVVIKEVRGERKNVTLFEYSLTHCHGTPGEPIFDVSELLFLNNTPCGDEVAPVLELNNAQRKFWASKIPLKNANPMEKKLSPVEPEREKKLHTGSRLLMRSQSIMGRASKKEEKHPQPPMPDGSKSKRLSRFKMLQFKSSH